jgi:hypothetical protein
MWHERFMEFKNESPEGLGKQVRAFHQRLDELWGPPMQVFEAPGGPYGFNNPTLRIYRRPGRRSDAPQPPE